MASPTIHLIIEENKHNYTNVRGAFSGEQEATQAIHSLGYTHPSSKGYWSKPGSNPLDRTVMYIRVAMFGAVSPSMFELEKLNT